MSDNVKDFTPTDDYIRFKLYDTTYSAFKDIPVTALAEFYRLQSELDNELNPNILDSMFSLLLTAESMPSFRELLDGSSHHLGLGKATEILSWLMDEMGLGPTVPDTGSSPGQETPVSGTNSVANVDATVLSLPSS